MNLEWLKEYIAMDSQSGILVDIISKAIEGAFSEFARQQGYEQSYYQQPMTSANTAFSYGPIQQQSESSSRIDLIHALPTRGRKVPNSCFQGEFCIKERKIGRNAFV
jgi:hypothetical protein